MREQRPERLRSNSSDSGEQDKGSKMVPKGQEEPDTDAAGVGSRDLGISGHPAR